jgi:putative endopeptidase
MYKEGRMVGVITPPLTVPTTPSAIDPDQLVPVTATKAGNANSAVSLIIQGIGQDPSLFFIDPQMEPNWENLENKTLDELLAFYDDGWAYYDKFSAEQLTDNARNNAKFALSYILSYHLQQKYISPAFKDKYLNITKEIQASLRKRIERVEWMSQTTKNNALEKLDCCGLFVAYPDQWYEDGLADLSGCATLAEAVYLGNRGQARVKGHVMGGTDVFSMQIISATIGSTGFVPTDLSLVNSFYSATCNSIFIYPAILLPPLMPENVSLAYQYAVLTVIGHEFTHGFDSSTGSKYDKMGVERNWWTVADQMAFEERRDILANCYSHLEVDPVRAPGVYSDGMATQGEDIADLGGFLTVMDAYIAHLEADGFSGEGLKEQLRKYYESYADIWKSVYSDTKLATFPKKDEHSHARLRVNGVVMNTDMWYELYNVDRNNILYLPPERRGVIW